MHKAQADQPGHALWTSQNRAVAKPAQDFIGWSTAALLASRRAQGGSGVAPHAGGHKRDAWGAVRGPSMGAQGGERLQECLHALKVA